MGLRRGAFMVLLLLLILLGASMASAARAPRWQQDRFAISMWVDPVVHPDEFDARYAEMRSANFTVLLGGFGATTPGNVAKQLDACQRVGLRAIVSTCGGGGSGGAENVSPGACVGPSAGHPALWGFQMKDEPNAGEYPALREWSDAVATAAPGTLRFINLLPNYATPAQLGSPSYGEYVEEYFDATNKTPPTSRPDILCMDSYPYFELTDMSRNVSTDGYHRNLAVMRDAALRHGVPFWNFFNAMPFNNHLAPSEGQIAWQAFTSLAWGAKGVLYFTYWSPGFPPPPGAVHPSLAALKAMAEGANKTAAAAFSKGGGLINPVSYGIDGNKVFEPTLQYAYARRVNSVLLNFGTFLLNATSVAVWRPDRGDPPPVECPLLGLVETNGSPDATYLIGVFSVPTDESAKGAGGSARAGGERGGRRGGGRTLGTSTGVLVQNQQFDREVWPTVTLRDGVAAKLHEVDESTGMLRPVRDDSSSMPGLQMALGPGMARLLVVLT